MKKIRFLIKIFLLFIVAVFGYLILFTIRTDKIGKQQHKTSITSDIVDSSNTTYNKCCSECCCNREEN